MEEITLPFHAKIIILYSQGCQYLDFLGATMERDGATYYATRAVKAGIGT